MRVRDRSCPWSARAAALAVLAVALTFLVDPSAAGVEVAETNAFRGRLTAAGGSSRLPGSPYPAASLPVTTLLVVREDKFSDADQLLSASLQGVVARSGSPTQLYRVTGEPTTTTGTLLPGGMSVGGYSRFWLAQAKAQNPAVAVDSGMEGQEVSAFVHKFSGLLKGYVLVQDLSDGPAVNAAVTYAAGCPDGVVVATSAQSAMLEGLGLKAVFNATSQTVASVLDQLPKSAFSDSIVIYQKPELASFLADYAVFARAIFFYEADIKSPFAASILSRMRPGGALLGWGPSEFDTVKTASSHSVWVNCADLGWDLSVLSSLPAFSLPPSALGSAGHDDTAEVADDKHTVAFVMSDGDNLQWLLNGFATDEKWYGSKERGAVPIGWTVSMAAVELLPTVMSYLHQGATANDTLVGGVSGVGYLFPSDFASLESHSNVVGAYSKAGGMRIVNILDDANAINPAVAASYLAHDEVDAVLYYMYSDYAGGKGQVVWSGDKPAISGRAMLWSGFNTPESLAALLNKQSTDPTVADGYSIIPVHAWSMAVADIVRCASLLGPNVEVVTPAALVARMKANVKH